MDEQLSEDAVFRVAFGIDSPELRDEYLRQVSLGRPALYDRVNALLRASGEERGFLESPATGVGVTLDMPIADIEKPGMKIGRYKLIHEIGHGGMGVVYMAVQKEPVKRKVALKIIKPGMDTKEVVARFEAERQALAMMDHQNIAKVLDGGSTESGRPYFVMELVEGTPIHEYCDACRYTTRQRLELFIQVCQAVQHAHLKGVIHRDIKPSNILVTNYDHLAVPKVIDFGIAKAVHQPLTDASVYTQVSQMIGTPLYMSPEQAQRTGVDVDTRTDVYSLGVLLYELLTGTTPFDKERLQNSGLDEVKRIIREEEPPKPSARLSTLEAALDTIVEKHYTDLRTLTQELSGELDWIVMKALEKDRNRRYESASDFAKDVQRYLDDEPVEACPPSTAYRLRKFARRHKAQFLAVATIAAVLIIATAISSGLAAWAVQSQGVAKTERADALNAKELAERAAETAREQQRLAKEQEELAKKQRDAAEYSLYVSDMRLARHELSEGTDFSVLQLLNAHRPEPGRCDFRGWEWYYFFSQRHRERLAFPLQRIRLGSNSARDGESAIAWSPDGKSLATVDSIGLINIWDVTSGERKGSLKEWPGWISSLDWSPDGMHLAAGSDQASVTIWHVASGERQQTLYGHTVEVCSIDWNPDGVRIASGGENGMIRIWDSQTGKMLSSLVGPYAPVLSLDWHPNGSQLLANYGIGFHGELRIWDTASGDEFFGWPTGIGRRASFSPDGSRVVWDSGRITDVKTGKVVSSFSAGSVHKTAWNPSGDRLATPVIGGVKIWDAATGMEVSSIQQFAPWLDWSPVGSFLAGTDCSGMVMVWDAAAVGEAITLPTPDRKALSVAFSPDGRHILAGARLGLFKVWDVATRKETLSVQQTEPTWIKCVAWSPDGRQFACRSGTDVVIYDSVTGKQAIPLLQCEDESRSLAWSPDGKTLAVGLLNRQFDGGRGRVRLFDATTGKTVATSAYAEGWCVSIAWAPDGKRLAATGAAGQSIRVWDSQLHLEHMIGDRWGLFSVDWSPDGKQLAAGHGFGPVFIYDATTWDLLHRLDGHANSVYAIAWHPQMARLASGDVGGKIRLWDTSTGRFICTLDAGDGSVDGLDWSPDGLRLAAACEKTVRIWDASPAYRFFEKHGCLREEIGTLVHEGKCREAIDVLERLRSLHPEEEELEMQIQRVKWLQANQLARDGQLDEAVAVYRRLSAESGDLPDYRLQLPAVLFDATRETEAIRMLEGSVAAFPETREYQDELAFMYERRAIQFCARGRFEEAAPILLKLASGFPERPDFRAELAFQAAKANRLEETMAALGKLANEFSHWPDYRPELARRLAGNREFARAVSIYEQLSAERPDVPEYHSELSKLLEKTKDNQDPKPEEKREPSKTNSPTQQKKKRPVSPATNENTHRPRHPPGGTVCTLGAMTFHCNADGPLDGDPLRCYYHHFHPDRLQLIERAEQPRDGPHGQSIADCASRLSKTAVCWRPFPHRKD